MSVGFTIAAKARRLVLVGWMSLMFLSPHMTHAVDASPTATAPDLTSALAPEYIHARPGIILTVFFGSGSAELTTSSRRALDAVAPQLRAYLAEGVHVVLDGHSDATGTPYYNLDLSNQRARAVAIYLRDAWEISLLRLRLRALGDSDPRRSDQPLHAENRRVEITLLEGRDVAKRGLSLRPRVGGHLDLDDFGGAISPLPISPRIITDPAPSTPHR